MTMLNNVSAKVLMDWAKGLATCANPLGLTEEILQQSLKDCAPHEYEGGEFLGRYIIPRNFVRYDATMQPVKRVAILNTLATCKTTTRLSVIALIVLPLLHLSMQTT